MTLSPHARARLLLVATYAVAVLLSIVPVPVWAEAFRPDWVSLVVIYWCVALPSRVGVGTGWTLGLILDVLYGSLLGLHAATKALVAYLAVRFHPQVRMFPRWQQSVAVGVLLLIGQVLVLWVRGAIGKAPETMAYWTPAIVGTLLWPWVFVILRDIRRRGDIR
jgi:rod shape-determining protein MreD